MSERGDFDVGGTVLVPGVELGVELAAVTVISAEAVFPVPTPFVPVTE
ncbi:hypothetical protein NTG1052_300011 [Candidatus Nitrotoga sp. 1052]|nr:hypothetical protein NTG1052_300011 [Candidatus Nitrotoga sp. 1052]